MSSAGNQQHTFPAMPPSLSAGDYELRDYHDVPDAPQPSTYHTRDLTPYLGLRARLSQIWLNRWTVLLLLVLVRTLIAVSSLDQGIANARTQALSACSSVESMGSAMASMPHYMSQGVNELAASGVEKAVNGLYSMLTLTVTGVEAIFIFYLSVLYQTYLCLLTMAVDGTLGAGIQLVADGTEYLNKTLGPLTDDIASAVDTFESSLNKFISTLNSIPDVFGSSGIPTLNINDTIDEIRNVTLPSSLYSDLQTLNNSLPSFDQVKNTTEAILELPFEEVKKLINQSMGTYTFDRTLLPVPPQQQLSFCSDNNGVNGFFDNLVSIEITARKIFIGVIIVLAILACIPMAWWEIKRWNSMQDRAKLVSKHGYDSMDVIYIASRPITASIGMKLSNRSSSNRRQVAIRWVVAYVTSIPALFILSLGIAGLIACGCQYILLKEIEKEVPALTDQVSAFADKVVESLTNASEQWAIGVNDAINKTSTDINNEVFGWVGTSTTAVNNTLNEFVDGVMDVLNTTFGGTVLYNPILEVLNCLLFLKIQGIEAGLTWVHDNAHIDFPLLPDDVFSLGAAASINNSSSDDSFLSSPGSVTSDKITEVVDSLISTIAAGIRQETIISACLIIVYCIVVFIALCRALWVYMRREKTRAEGGRAYIVDPVADSMRVHEYPDTSAPPYEYPEPPINKAAPYTLQARPFPTFEPSSSSQPSAEDEKVGSVEARNVGVAVTRPTHVRSSSHGDLGGTTPVLHEKSENPFADSARY